jgi:exopolysaccharide biosynthesis polyprenyl glycosylphosphotransferase
MSGILSDSLSSVTRRSIAKSDRGDVRTRVRSQNRWRGIPLVIEEGLFRDALLREQRRADRFEQPFVLVLVSRQTGRPCDSSTWLAVIEALTLAKRDTDILGWFSRGSTLGMIVPEVDANLSNSREVESRVQMALARRLDADAREAFSVRSHRHALRTPAISDAGEIQDPVLSGLRSSVANRIRSGLKRMLDIAASGALLLALSPLFLLIAALVKLKSPGPVFFRQSRIGENGQPFTMLKFRTMRVNADNAIHKEFVSQLIKGASPTGGDAVQEAPFKIVNDPRVTSIGRFLRKTSLDELPQLWNVLRGDMSLVGPRPPLAYEVEQYKPWHYRRVLEAKPGITGLWQVSGRSRTTFDDMVRLDLRYAKNPSAWADIKILIATPRAVISGKGAC